MSEWTSQASLERLLGLPCTVQDKDDPHSEAKSQIFFGSTFAKPLWEVLVEGVPGECFGFLWEDELAAPFSSASLLTGFFDRTPAILGPV